LLYGAGGHVVSSWPELLACLLRGESLQAGQTAWAMDQIMCGDASGAQQAGFAVALRAKGETAEEVAGLVGVMVARAAALPLPPEIAQTTVDTCGTVGDLAHTVNLSTMAALVVAGTGRPVVKHGNRAASSACGSADLLEALGVVVDLRPDDVATCVREAGIGFCFAPVFHPALRHTAAARREIGVPTVFNILGPLTNPAHPPSQAVGVAEQRLAPVLADVLARRGTSALVFRGDDGLDELTTSTTSTVWTVIQGQVVAERFDPLGVGIPRAGVAQLRGGDAATNAGITRLVLAGAVGPVRDAVLLNAAAAIAAATPRQAKLGERLSDGLREATVSLDSGAAAEALDRLVEVSRAAGRATTKPDAQR
jgi:anthranilate phosphoribosyltransferase